MKILKKSFEVFQKKKLCDRILIEKFELFCEKNSFWLEDYALFMALKEEFDLKPWFLWDKDLKFRKKETLLFYKEKLQSEMLFHKYLQFIFFKQWLELKAYANNNYIKIIGDLPIYIAHDSADCWANTDIFLFDEKKDPIKISGVPPDYFSATGQLWGNPV